jgi:hypothetical protein
MVLINAIRMWVLGVKIDARYIGRGRSVWRVKPRILLEMTTLRRTLQTRKTDSQELYPSELLQMMDEPICPVVGSTAGAAEFGEWVGSGRPAG